MKKILFVIPFALLFSSACTKNDAYNVPSPAQSETAQLLIGEPWIMDAIGVDTNKSGFIDSYEWLQADPCDINSVCQFFQNGTVESNTMATCNPGITSSKPWHVLWNGTAVYWDNGTGNQYNSSGIPIKSISNNTLIFAAPKWVEMITEDGIKGQYVYSEQIYRR